jgi:hypothetical protein
MRPTTAIDDNVFDFDHLTSSRHQISTLAGRGLSSVPEPRGEAGRSSFVGL